MGRTKVRLTLDLSPELDQLLQRLADMMGVTKSEVMRKSITLMELAVEAKRAGKRFGIAHDDQNLATEIVGLWGGPGAYPKYELDPSFGVSAIFWKTSRRWSDMTDSPNQVDLNQVIENKQYELIITSIETISELETRLKALQEAATYERRRDLALHFVAAMVVMAIVALCVWLLLKGSPTSDEARWATTTLSAVVAGVLGFWTGALTRPSRR
jgi:predicted transcriptional regulator